MEEHMLLIPNETLKQYTTYIKTRGIIAAHHGQYKKWLRYYLDFCSKYPVPEANSERVRLFCEKLRDKKQSESLREQAAHAVSLYFEMLRNTSLPKPHDYLSQPEDLPGIERKPVVSDSPPQYASAIQAEETQRLPARRSSSQYTEAGYQEKSKSPEWDAVLATMAAEIKVRHYSRKTLKTYANWSRLFQRFLKDKSPHELTTADVKDYLTFLAVKCHVAASTQNQAFSKAG
jgi:site-specific recombinase XerD